MCIVSAITDYGRGIWPDPLRDDPWQQRHLPLQPQVPRPFIATPYNPDPNKLLVDMKEYHELLEKAKKLDELLGQPDCPEPDKAAWIAALEERIKRLEDEAEARRKIRPDRRVTRPNM